jgi:hypothetical protein
MAQVVRKFRIEFNFPEFHTGMAVSSTFRENDRVNKLTQNEIINLE